MGVSSAENTLEKTTKLDDFSTGFFSVCDTCDSKKTKPLLEGVRTRMHVWVTLLRLFWISGYFLGRELTNISQNEITYR